MSGDIVKFDFRNTIVTFGGLEIQGFAKESDSISFQYNTDGGSLDINAEGTRGLHVVDTDSSGMATLKLQQSSDSNDFLQEMFERVKKGLDTGYSTLMFQDLNRSERWMLRPAFVKTPSVRSWGTSGNNRQWSIEGVCMEKIGGGTFAITA